MYRRCAWLWAIAAPTQPLQQGGYKFFEDMYPKHEPPPRYANFEEQSLGITVKNCEPKKQISESEKLHHLHNWKKDDKGIEAPPEFGWAEEWGPEPGEDGHNDWYKKHRMFMSYEEKAKYDMRTGVPLERGATRHHEMPLTKRMKASYHNLQQESPQWFDTRERGYWGKYTYEQKQDSVIKSRDEYINEWLEKPGVTKNNVAKTIADYNGTAKQQRVVPVARKPEWELAPKNDAYD